MRGKKSLRKVLILASPYVILVVVTVWVYNLRAEDVRAVPVSGQLENAINVSYPEKPETYDFAFGPDGKVGVRTPDGLSVEGEASPSRQQFLESLPANPSVARFHRVDDQIWRGRGPTLSEIYFTTLSTDGASKALVFKEEYPLSFGSWWGQWTVRNATSDSITLHWTNSGNVVWTLILLLAFGPVLATVAMWRLGLFIQHRARMTTPLDRTRLNYPLRR